MRRRLCAICHLPGHDRRSHKPAKAVRRNVERGFYDGNGFHPIRASRDYDYRRTESDWTRRDILSAGFAYRDSATGQFVKPDIGERLAILKTLRPRAYKEHTEPQKELRRSRLPRSIHRIEKLAVEVDSLEQSLKDDRAAALTDLIRKSGKERGEINRIPWGQGRAIISRYGGHMPKSDAAIVKDRQGRRYMRWEYVLDTVADELGYRSSDALKDAVERAQKDKQRLRDMRAELDDLEQESRKRSKRRA